MRCSPGLNVRLTPSNEAVGLRSRFYLRIAGWQSILCVAERAWRRTSHLICLPIFPSTHASRWLRRPRLGNTLGIARQQPDETALLPTFARKQETVRILGVKGHSSMFGFHEFSDEFSNLVGLRIECEVARVKYMHFRGWYISSIALRFAKIK